jgi:glycosyltransferase involved in cell wall biosynthesis
MGVLFISSAEQPGADTFVHTLIMRSLDRARFDVHVACSAGDPAQGTTGGYDLVARIPDVRVYPANFGPSLFQYSGVEKVRRLLTGGAATILSFLTLARYIRNHGIAILHSTDRPRDAVACAVLGKLTGAKSIIHAHLKCADWMSASLRRSMHQVDAIIGVSGFVAESLVECGYPRAKTHAVLNAIDLPHWDFRLSGASVRQELGIPAGAPVISCAARLFRGKGQDVVIRAVSALRPEFPELRLLVIGKDDRQAMRDSFTAELKALARDLGVTDNVIFTGQRSDMPALLASSDIFALPSDEEPFGLVFAEAMAMKRPVIALSNGGTLEVVEHGQDGLLSAPKDLDGLVANLRTLLLDSALRDRMGEHGRRRVEALFGADRLAADTARVYAMVAAAGRIDVASAGERVTP